MIYNRFQGDPSIRMTDNGATMKFTGGQPVMDQGLENAVLISLFTKRGWWGNVLAGKESEVIGSDYLSEAAKPITELDAINRVTGAGNKALEWLRTAKIIKKATITVTNPRTDYLRADIKIEPPGEDIQTLVFINNGMSWIYQFNFPANER